MKYVFLFLISFSTHVILSQITIKLLEYNQYEITNLYGEIDTIYQKLGTVKLAGKQIVIKISDLNSNKTFGENEIDNISIADKKHAIVSSAFCKENFIFSIDGKLYKVNKIATNGSEINISDISNNKADISLDYYIPTETLQNITTNKNHTIKELTKQHNAKYILINRWATFCNPCIASIPLYQELVKSKDILLINLCSKEGINNALTIINEKKFPGYHFIESEYLVMKNGYPNLIIYDSKGKLMFRKTVTGFLDYLERQNN